MGIRQPLDKIRRGGQVGFVPFRAAVVHPSGNQMLIAIRQAGVILKMAILGTGKPGRHPAAGHNLGDCFGPAGHLVVRSQCEGSDLAVAMTSDAILIQNRRDVLCEGDRLVGDVAVNAPDEATDRRGRRLADRFAGKQFIDGIGQIIVDRRRAGNAHAILVIDHAAITNRAAGVEHEGVGSALGAKLIGDDVARILQDGKRDFVFASVMRDVGHRVLSVGVDADEGDSFVLVARRQLAQTRTQEFCDRTFVAEEDHHERFLAGPLIEPMRRAEIVVQLEAGDLFADGRRVDRRRGATKWFATNPVAMSVATTSRAKVTWRINAYSGKKGSSKTEFYTRGQPPANQVNVRTRGSRYV